MTREEFDALVTRLEQRWGAHPWSLRWRIAVLIALGYAGFLFWFVMVLLLGSLFYVGAVAVSTGPGLVLLALGAVLLTLGGLQAIEFLWVQLTPWPGREVRPHEAPELFAMLARLRQALRAARFHRVQITCEFNAGVQLLPRLGVFGWNRNHLLLGLPLLDSVAPQELEAVLAHECAHLSARHGRFTAWVCRLRRTWDRLFQRLHEPPKSGYERGLRRGLLLFVDWYWPRFNAHAFLLSRADEYAADRIAAEWAGTPSAASALWRIDCQERLLRQKFWPDLWQLANQQAEPPADVTARLAAALAVAPEPAEAARWMDQAACTLTDNLDTHPSLSDRLRAWGQDAAQRRTEAFPVAAHPSAAAVLFGARLEAIRREIDALWRDEAAEAWRARHARVGSLQQRLITLEHVRAEETAGSDLLWDKARMILDLEGPEAAEPWLRQLLALHPAHAAANLILGQHLLEQGQAAGEAHLQRILELEEDELIPRACEVLANHFQSAGLTNRLQQVRKRLSQFQAAAAAAQQERTAVSATDRLLPHELRPDELAALQALLEQQPDLAYAHLVRKELQHFPRQRLFVLCVRTAINFLGRSRADQDARLVARLIPQVKLPGRVLVIAPQGGFRALARAVRSQPQATIYPGRSC